MALHDINADGDLDIFDCCEGGNRAYGRVVPFVFEQVTAKVGLDGVRSVNVSFVDTCEPPTSLRFQDGWRYTRSNGSGVFRFALVHGPV